MHFDTTVYSVGAGIAQSVWLLAGRPRFYSRQGKQIFLYSTASRPALGPTQVHIQWVPGTLSPGEKRPGSEADHSSPSNAEVKND
jgi:hypothetical protein